MGIKQSLSNMSEEMYKWIVLRRGLNRFGWLRGELQVVTYNQPAGPLVDPLGKIVNIEQIWKNGPME